LSEKEVLQKLLINKRDYIEESVLKAQDLIGIDKESGDIIFLVSISRLSEKQKIGIYLIGKYFSNGLELSDSSTATIDEISISLGVERNNVSRRASEMKKEGIIKSTERGKYEIVPVRILEILENIKSKLEKQEINK